MKKITMMKCKHKHSLFLNTSSLYLLWLLKHTVSIGKKTNVAFLHVIGLSLIGLNDLDKKYCGLN